LFRDAELQAHFDALDWYYGHIAPDAFLNEWLNSFENANVALIQEMERRR
jgi:hypothetical protein